MRLTVTILFVAGVLLAALLAARQAPFADARFEYGQWRTVRGTLIRRPFPMLLAPGEVWPLAGAGKWTADRYLGDAHGLVELRGARIQRGGHQMLELEPGSLRPAAGNAASFLPVSLGHRRMTGEVVDSKCWLGVMNPGEGPRHRSCAARCLHGGVPPALVTSDGEFIWLVSKTNLSPWAGAMVHAEGELFTAQGITWLQAVIQE